jgi:hypothetical protein
MFWNGTGDGELLRDAYIYNNVFYNNTENGSGVFYLDNNHKHVLFANNIFLTDGPAFQGPSSNPLYLGNVYWNLGQSFSLEGYFSFQSWVDATGHEMFKNSLVGMNADPLLVNPGPITLTDPDSINLKTLGGFMLTAESPVINKGLDLLSTLSIDPGDSDLFGNEIPAGPGFDPGVHEFQDVTPGGLDEKRIIGSYGDNENDWIHVFPNPVGNGPVYLKFNESSDREELKIIIMDIYGKVVYSKNLPVQGELVRLMLPESFPRGMVYFISVRYNNKNKTFKLLF